jgi:hypothetical protein
MGLWKKRKNRGWGWKDREPSSFRPMQGWGWRLPGEGQPPRKKRPRSPRQVAEAFGAALLFVGTLILLLSKMHPHGSP